MIMTKVFTSVSILLLLALMVIPFSAAFAAGTDGLVTEYFLPGSPHHVVVEGAGLMWSSLPPQNAIDRLVIPGSARHRSAHFLPGVAP
jgi:hypothetical protein